MKKYQFLKHTADAKFKAYGKNLNEQFENAALAMFSIMFDIEKIKPVAEKKIEIKGIDIKAILYNFLEELLFLLDSQGFVLSQAKVSINKSKKTLTAVLKGDKAANYQSHGGVKAVTYAEMKILKNYVQVVVDV